MTDHFGLPESAIQQICNVFRQYKEVKRVLLYGSRAMGRERFGSDIDLCIESDTLSLSQMLAIETQIDDLLLPWKLDLSLRNRIDNPDVLKHIDTVGIEFYVASDENS